MGYTIEWLPSVAVVAAVAGLWLPSFALIALFVAALATLATFVVLAGAVLATPYLLRRSAGRARRPMGRTSGARRLAVEEVSR